jgi:hypothetical protein
MAHSSWLHIEAVFKLRTRCASNVGVNDRRPLTPDTSDLERRCGENEMDSSK